MIKKQVRNRLQAYDGGSEVLDQLFGASPGASLPPEVAERFCRTLQKRHPIAHNLGIVDRKYLEKVQTDEAEGRDVSLDEAEVIAAIDIALMSVRLTRTRLFGPDMTGDHPSQRPDPPSTVGACRIISHPADPGCKPVLARGGERLRVLAKDRGMTL